MESREQRITTLATTLKASGIAKSESQAKMMAEEMIGVEEHVQRNYEEKHAAAHEYLQNTKNLGNPRVIKSSPEQTPESKKIEPINLQGITSKSASSRPVQQEPVRQQEPIRQQMHTRSVEAIEQEYTDLSFGKKTLNQAFSEHDTHNAALESIKMNIQKDLPVQKETRAQDMGGHASAVRNVFSQAGIEIVHAENPEMSEVKKPELIRPVDLTPVQELEALEKPEELFLEAEKEEAQVEKEDERIEKEDKILGKEEVSVEGEVEKVKLDTAKLVDMMEEDGELEEHTREIKEKPKEIKPKEDFAENSIDLSTVFGIRKI